MISNINLLFSPHTKHEKNHGMVEPKVEVNTEKSNVHHSAEAMASGAKTEEKDAKNSAETTTRHESVLS